MEIESTTSTSQKCSEVLNELQAKSQIEELSKFVRQELNGYGDSYPEYRLVAVTYFDRGGQIVTNIAPEYCNYPLTYGVDVLESHLKNGLALKLPPEVLSFLSQASQNAIAGAHVGSKDLQGLLERILVEAQKLDRTE
jgi:hypothetical protein